MKKLTTFLTLLLFPLVLLAYQPPAIHITTSGEGHTILFLPGFTTPGSVWDETIDNLQGQYQAVQISYAGFNGLEPIAMPWYNTLKKELINYVKEQGLQDFTIVGHSMGGNLAVELAAEFPERVYKLIIVDALPCMRELMMPGVSADQIQYESPYNQRMLEMSDEAFKQTATMMARGMTARPEYYDILIQWSLEAQRETYVYGYTDLLKLDLRETLPLVKAPTLILGAPFPDEAMVKANFEKQYAKLANKQMAIASDSKHFIMLDQPQWFYEKVNAFLGQ